MMNIKKLTCCKDMEAAQEEYEGAGIRCIEKPFDDPSENGETEKTDIYYLYWGEASQSYGNPINYCPWCGMSVDAQNWRAPSKHIVDTYHPH